VHCKFEFAPYTHTAQHKWQISTMNVPRTWKGFQQLCEYYVGPIQVEHTFQTLYVDNTTDTQLYAF